MIYRTLGRTGLNVSILGLGSGGASRLGQRYNFSTTETERLVNPTAVEACVRQWEHEGLLQPGAVQPNAPLDWLLDEQTPSLAAAAYKFAAAHPAVGTMLTGTASLDHFESNLQAILGPPLPRAKLQRVQDVFGPVQRNVQPERVSR